METTKVPSEIRSKIVPLMCMLSLITLNQGCAPENEANTVAPIGKIQRVQYLFAGWKTHTQLDTASVSILVSHYAPIPLQTQVELRGSKDQPSLLCATGSATCWSIAK